MRYKRRTSDKKRFWLGMAACAMVGFVAYATSYFSSGHVFTNEYKTKKYDVKVYNVFDNENATGLWPNKKNELNEDLVIKNDSDGPVFLRIKYVVGSEDRETGEYTYLDAAGYSWFNHALEADSNVKFQNKDKFLFNGETGNDLVQDTDKNMDGYYYYKGVLGPNESIQHIDGFTCGGGTYSNDMDSYTDEYLYSNGDKWIDSNGTIEDDHLVGKRMNAHLYEAKNVIRIYVETIQATDKDGKDIKINFDNATASGMKAFWTALGK